MTAPPGTILVVDDQPANRELVRATLAAQGHRVVLAADGFEALEQWTAEAPDVVVLDVRMPGIDGFEVCARLRGLPGGADVPVVFLTAVREVDAFERALELGAVDFLTKPIQPAELLLRVGAAVQLRRIGAEREELYELLRHQRDDAVRLGLQKERLAGFLVHDLKNPVAGMKLASEIIARDPAVPDRLRDVADRIGLDAAKLLRMIGDLLDLSRAADGRLPLERAPVPVGALVDEVLSALALRARTSQVELRADVEPLSPSIDRELVRRVVENLVENAIRHAPRGSAVTVAARREGAAVVLRVVDGGPGVAPELRDHLFDRYAQGTNGSRGGQGLGLAFCKLAVEAHGGTIRVEDTASGASFAVALPDGSPDR